MALRRVSLGWMLRYGAARAGIGVHDIFFNAVAGFYLASYGMSNAAIGFLSNERSFVGGPLLPIVGGVSDRIRTPLGRRKPFMLLVALVVLGFLALMARPDTWMVVAIFVAGPAVFGLAVTIYEVLLPDSVVPEQRGTANGVNRMLGFASGMGLLLVAFQLWETHPAIVFLAVAASLSVGFAVTLLTVREPEAPVRAAPPINLDPVGYVRGLLRHREATKYVACYLCFWFGIGGITPFITRFGHQELDIPERETFLLLLAVMVTTLLFAAPAGWLGDHVGKKVVTSWGIAAFALFIFMGSLLQTKEQAIIVLGLAGLAQAVPTVLAYPLFTELVPGARMGELTGMSTMVWSLAQPLGATVLGAVADQTGTLRSVMVGGAISLMIAWAILQTVHPSVGSGSAAPAGAAPDG